MLEGLHKNVRLDRLSTLMRLNCFARSLTEILLNKFLLMIKVHASVLSSYVPMVEVGTKA